jgi:gluconate 2-dehydrogenase gamma chain
MANRAEWPVVTRQIPTDNQVRLFFSEHEWASIEAATARIYPTDHEPGAREANVVRFIDRYISGLDYVFASADGSGFLQMSGRDADAWRVRIARLQEKYRNGVRELDAIANAHFDADFSALDEDRQDQVLEVLSGAPKPRKVATSDHGEAHVQNISDDDLSFFNALVLHTREGVFGDPVYGGNSNRVGWTTIGFPGPNSLADTRDCTYGHPDKFLNDFDWADLIPHLRAKTGIGRP